MKHSVSQLVQELVIHLKYLSNYLEKQNFTGAYMIFFKLGRNVD